MHEQPSAWNPRAAGRRVAACLLRDQARLRKTLRDLQRATTVTASMQQAFEQALCEAEKRATERKGNLPTPVFPEELPVVENKERLAEAIREHPVVIVAGETGSGKTTQLPKICLELGRGTRGLIGCTQPRRIAAIGVAGRVAEELETSIGEAVGYQIRFDARTRPETYVKFMTDGILLAEIQADRDLLQYDTLIIDEAHERSLNIDFLLGYLKTLLQKRRDLKVIVSSATLDVERFAAFFDDAPVMTVEGRTYPVEVRYRPPEEEDADLPPQIGRAVGDLLERHGEGDVLVFLPGERDIRETADHLRRRTWRGVEILPLYGRLSASEQRRVFAPGKERRVVLATNVAETSITVPRIRFVVDTGFARIKRFDHRTQIERLLIERISRASAAQRAGRCGRIAPGVCVRLYDEDEFEQRADFTDPEIRRTSLASVILQMQEQRLGQVETFPFVDPPQAARVRAGFDELFELGAIDENRRLTKLGRRMARLPVEPRYARMLLAAADEGALQEVLILAAGLSIQDPRERPLEKREQADTLHNRYRDDDSDFVAMLNLWRFYERETRALPSKNQIRKWCKANFLNALRMREWHEIRRQLAETMRRNGAHVNTTPASYEQIHRSLLAGLLSRMGKCDEDGNYRGARDTRFVLWPGSFLKKRKPAWIVAGEIVETSRLFARLVAKVEPAWAEHAGAHCIKRSYRQPHWDEASGLTRAFEQVSLFGLPIVERRRVHYGPIDPEKSRALLIRDGLIGGQMQTRLDCYRHNLDLVAEIEENQAKLRRNDLLVDPESLVRFYDKRLPGDIVTVKQLERWVRSQANSAPRMLHMTREDVEVQTANGLSADRFPPAMEMAGTTIHLEYAFTPGEERDGVSARVPVGVLPQIETWRLAWLVPGLLGEKVALLLRGLPRRYRREIQPIPETAQAVLDRLTFQERPLPEAVADALLRVCGVRIDPAEFDESALPTHLRMNVIALDTEGNEQAEGRDLDELQVRCAGEARKAFVRVDKRDWEREELVDWPAEYDTLPPRIETGGVVAFPTLRDDGETVTLCLEDDPARAAWMHEDGVLRLLALRLAPQLGRVAKSLRISQAAELIYAGLGGGASGKALRQDLVLSGVRHVALEDQPPIRDDNTFQARADAARGVVFEATTFAAQAVSDALEQAGKTYRQLIPEPARVHRDAVLDLRDQLQRMIYPGFVRHALHEALTELPRYQQAMAERLARLQRAPQKDHSRLMQLAPHWQHCWAHWKTTCGACLHDDAWVRLRWMLEEWRVSLFAQELGTREKVSEKRIRELAREIASTA